MKQKKILMLPFLALVVGLGLLITYLMMPTRNPNDPHTLTDNTNDFVTVEGETTVNLAVVDITRVEIINDGENLQVAITTSRSLPATGPQYPANYVVVLRVMADDDNKFARIDIIMDGLGWSLGSYIGGQLQMEDKSSIKYQKSSNTVTFKVPLNLEEWGKDPQKMSVQVMAGYESDDVRIYDLVPNQKWLGSEYIEYELWK